MNTNIEAIQKLIQESASTRQIAEEAKGKVEAVEVKVTQLETKRVPDIQIYS